jgi:ATP-dependent helicase/nuclease subunit A
LLEREQAAREREEINGLYVALTRARELLVLSAVAPHQGAHEGSWWARVLPLAQPWTPETASAPASQAAQSTVVLQVLPGWRRTASVSMPRSTEAQDPRQARLGQALHRVLEWATATGAPALSTLVQAACATFGLGSDAHGPVLAAAKAVLASPSVRRFFEPAMVAWAGNEVTVVDGESVLRIDRLVALDEGGRRTWWILDYKLQSAPQSIPVYREQLARYRAVLQRLQPRDEVRAAFITAAGEVIEDA